ncbi:MAG: hypothetical protein E6J90_17660 [Deltaproteobacteria bacterium]|nr:MAG: hypothetical protein E6J91_32035 [Deltaproteobacteria bacterium]TMQ19572.1 MAG: hypothetical protein E6J90_17660 [Deltaproteobacteria bacterium]
MRKLGLLLLICAACGAKKPAAKPAAPAPTEQTEDKKSPSPDAKPTPVQRTGDPCDGGEKPH